MNSYEDTSSPVRALEIAKCLLLGQCRVALRPLLLSTSTSQIEEESLPYAPVLYREALLDITYISIQQECASNNKKINSPQVAVEEGRGGPFSPYPVSFLLPLLSNPISEVREGVLLGCLKALTLISADTSDKTSVNDIKQYVLHSTCILEDLLSRAGREMEPPLRNLTLQLMCRYDELQITIALANFSPGSSFSHM